MDLGSGKLRGQWLRVVDHIDAFGEVVRVSEHSWNGLPFMRAGEPLFQLVSAGVGDHLVMPHDVLVTVATLSRALF